MMHHVYTTKILTLFSWSSKSYIAYIDTDSENKLMYYMITILDNTVEQ